MSQYSRWRRLALQGAMCLVLIVSVAAAAYVGHQRRPATPTLGPVTEHGMLRYALPIGWEVTTERGVGVSNLSVEEPRNHGRTLEVSVVTKARRMDAESLIATTLRHRLEGEPIAFLGQEGVLVEASFRGTPAPDEGDGDEGQFAATVAMSLAERSGLYAAVVLRDGTGVLVSLRGEGAFGPSSRKLIKQVIGTMQILPSAGVVAEGTKPAPPGKRPDLEPRDSGVR